MKSCELRVQLILYLQDKFFGEDEVTAWVSAFDCVELGFCASLKAATYVAGFGL